MASPSLPLRLVLVSAVLAATLGLWILPASSQEGAPPPPPAEQPEVAWLYTNEPALSWSGVEVPPVPYLAHRVGPGKELFARLCAPCHGAHGRGDGRFAPDLPTRPRDLAREQLRTRDRAGPVSPEELYRSITAGAPVHGMPAFDHLPVSARWSLIAFLQALRGEGWAGEPAPLPARPEVIDRDAAAKQFGNLCAPCHGGSGDGEGAALDTLVDAKGRFVEATNLAYGPTAFRGGGSLEDVVRLLTLGRPGSPMPQLSMKPADTWGLAQHVVELSQAGHARRKQAWNTFFSERRRAAQSVRGRTAEPGVERWEAPRSEHFSRAPAGKRGCLACHEGISDIASGAMAEALRAFAGGDAERECVVCHEGLTGATEKARAHTGLVSNPGSLWATSIGLGCGKCHSNRRALTSLHGRELPEPTGGGLMSVISRQTDPSGASGSNHAYRIQRALMAQETGKAFLVSASAGLVEGTPRYTDFAVDDPDGEVPSAGTDRYKAFMKRAEAKGFLLRLARGEPFPTFDEAEQKTGSATQAAYADYFRKDCARCHLWGEGKPADGERRSSGCSACHILNATDGMTEDEDPTVPDDRPGHPLRHQLTMAIPEEQCNHCHTRGVLTLHSEPHQKVGIGCVDCHTSIDIHGDGNIYGAIPHQLEIRCEDCHGTARARPWDLPLGFGTPAVMETPRGTYQKDGTTYLFTSRGNPRANWLREGDKVVVRSFLDQKRHDTPLLGARTPKPVIAGEKPGCPMNSGPEHDSLTCFACHNQKAPRCMPCHLTYFGTESSQDWLLSALDYDPASTRQRTVKTPGTADPRPLGGKGLPWGPPDVRPDRAGRLNPHIPGCDVTFTYVDPKGKVDDSFVPRHNPSGEDYPPPVAPSLPHEFADPPRTCADCHPQGSEKGKPIVLPGSDR